LDKGFSPRCSATYNTLIDGLCKQGKLYEAIIFLEEMMQEGVSPDIVVWNSLVSSICKKKAIQKSIDQLRINLEGQGCRL